MNADSRKVRKASFSRLQASFAQQCFLCCGLYSDETALLPVISEASLKGQTKTNDKTECPLTIMGKERSFVASPGTTMAYVGNGAGHDVDEEHFEDAYESIPTASKMDLKTALEECTMALNLFLNNKFSEALDMLRPWAKASMYHALGYSTILVMQAAMTFEHQDIQMGISVMKDALQTCQRFRKKNTVVESISNLVSKQAADQFKEEEMHADLCYAECLLQKAALTFLQDENMISFIKGQDGTGINKITGRDMTGWDRIGNDDTFMGWDGTGTFLTGQDRTGLKFHSHEFGLSQLREGASSHSLRAVLSVLTLLLYHTYVALILGSGEGNLVEAEALLEPYLKKFPNAIYVFQKAAILSMLPGEVVTQTGENVTELFKQVEGLKQKIAGKSIPTEKFAVRKSRRYSAPKPVKLVVPALEMMYVWNGFTIVGKRADHTESLLITIEQAEVALNQETNPSEYHPDDQCLIQMLKGLCLKHLGRLLQAELCFTQVTTSEKRIKYDHYLVPFSLYELGLLYKQQGDFQKAIRFIENAKQNYKGYSMESRLHFRIHAALNSLRGSPATTP
ncbi:UNVERIFIED_CONTAM: hypothetical protein FKN15_029136 [Acipenser sinensis]